MAVKLWLGFVVRIWVRFLEKASVRVYRIKDHKKSMLRDNFFVVWFSKIWQRPPMPCISWSDLLYLPFGQIVFERFRTIFWKVHESVNIIRSCCVFDHQKSLTNITMSELRDEVPPAPYVNVGVVPETYACGRNMTPISLFDHLKSLRSTFILQKITVKNEKRNVYYFSSCAG